MGTASLAQWISTQFDASVTWKDLEQIRQRWKGKLIVKGIMDPEDARQVVDAGRRCARRLEPRRSPARRRQFHHRGAAAASSTRCRVVAKCWSMAASAAGRTSCKSLALGASATLTGRAFLYGLGAMGGAGVTAALQIMSRELQVSMALSGCNDVREVDRTILVS